MTMTQERPPRCLIVGAGAVGQVYGHHLQAGGADIGFYVRPKYAAEVGKGLRLYRRKKSGDEEISLSHFAVLTSPQEVEAAPWDYIFLCVSSPALRAGTWLADISFANSIGAVVHLQAGQKDFEFVRDACSAMDVVSGMIPFASYQCPLPSDDLAEGVAYWFPPRMSIPFSGADDHVEPLVATLKAGGMSARKHPDVRTSVAFGQALLQTQILVLECAGWKIDDMQRDTELMRLAAASMKEALRLNAHARSVAVPNKFAVVGRRSLGFLMRTFRRLAPMDLDEFFEYHYTKVHEQSMKGLSEWIKYGQDNQIETAALSEVQARLLARSSS